MAHEVEIVRTVADLRERVGDWRRHRHTAAVVPTMGALHEGHIALVRNGLKHADRIVVTIFVNPKQFAANEDLSRYPRDEAGDVAKLKAAGAHLVFAPDPAEIYPDGFATEVITRGPATAGLEDRFRPHFFTGVATVVAKLFIAARCDYAMFGEKDYQQLLVVTQMVRDLGIPTQVLPVETTREPDGLAMSSRNAYLSAEERAIAPKIHQALSRARQAILSGGDPDAAASAAVTRLEAAGFRVDYVAARHARTLAPVAAATDPIRLLAAAWLGKTRLIDNIAVL
ncbi:MAG: pantoate--beta-alanine ligase [Hyphomicrobiales bacterium]